MDISLRDANPTDANEIANIFQLAHQARMGNALPHETNITKGKDFIANSFRQENTWAQVACLGTDIVGAIIGGAVNSDTISTGMTNQIHDLIVDPHYWDRGVASKLIEWAINHCKKSGLDQIELLSQVNNERANHIYEKYGFVRQEEIQVNKQTGENLYHYSLQLNK